MTEKIPYSKTEAPSSKTIVEVMAATAHIAATCCACVAVHGKFEDSSSAVKMFVEMTSMAFNEFPDTWTKMHSSLLTFSEEIVRFLKATPPQE